MPMHTHSVNAELPIPRIIRPGWASRGCAQERVKCAKRLAKFMYAVETKSPEYNSLWYGLSVALITKSEQLGRNRLFLSLVIESDHVISPA